MSKDIFDLFRDNEDKLNQAPSPKTWSRIERRIQAPTPIAKRRKMRSVPPPLSIAAALALVIGLMVAFMWVLEKETNQAIILAHGPLEMEDLVISSNHSEVEQQIKAVQYEYVKPLKPIREGRPEQKLIATTEKTSTPAPSNTHIDSIREERMGR